VETASATAVSTFGLKEWMSSFCSVKAHKSNRRQLSGCKFIIIWWKPAPLEIYQWNIIN